MQGVPAWISTAPRVEGILDTGFPQYICDSSSPTATSHRPEYLHLDSWLVGRFSQSSRWGWFRVHIVSCSHSVHWASYQRRLQHGYRCSCRSLSWISRDKTLKHNSNFTSYFYPRADVRLDVRNMSRWITSALQRLVGAYTSYITLHLVNKKGTYTSVIVWRATADVSTRHTKAACFCRDRHHMATRSYGARRKISQPVSRFALCSTVKLPQYQYL